MPKQAFNAEVAAGKVRRYILCRAEPFCISDLYAAMAERGVSDRDMVLGVLKELYGCGLVTYDCRGNPGDGSEWAFRTRFPRMHM